MNKQFICPCRGTDRGEYCSTVSTTSVTGNIHWSPQWPSPFNRLVDPPPLGVVSLRLKTSTSGFSLLGNADGACVDDVATFAWPQSGIDQLLVLLAPPPVGACQRLPCSHHHLCVTVVLQYDTSGHPTPHKQKFKLHFPGTHHAILLMVVAKNWKTTTVPEGSYFPQRVIINIFGHCQ